MGLSFFYEMSVLRTLCKVQAPASLGCSTSLSLRKRKAGLFALLFLMPPPLTNCAKYGIISEDLRIILKFYADLKKG